MIVPFKLDEEEFAEWTQTIFRLFPTVTPIIIGKITDQFLKGEIEFDRNIGILNYTSIIGPYVGIIKK